MNADAQTGSVRGPSPLERFLKVFGEVREGEGITLLLMFFNILCLLGAFYILKTVREPLILMEGGAELKSYASAFQAVFLVGYVPLYGWVASRLPRQKFLRVVILFFVACIVLFVLGISANVPHIGFAFFIWLGIFSVSLIAQFWSYANDIYTEEQGKRLFAIIAVGATAGAPIGAFVAGHLFDAGIKPTFMLWIAGVLLIIHLVLYRIIGKRVRERDKNKGKKTKPLKKANGFAMVMKSRYLMLIAALLVVLNIVNTTGEYILSSTVLEIANEEVGVNGEEAVGEYIGGFYGTFFFWVNIATILIQALLVSRIVKYMGMAGALFILPIISLGAYSLVALGAGFVFFRALKTAENSTDYSLMNTTKQLLWLPTSVEEKYNAKQAIDTFFVRAGDVISAGIVFVGTTWLSLSLAGFGLANVVFVLIWLGLAFLLLRENKGVTGRYKEAKAAAAEPVPEES
ncbi:MAG: Npt1/Npt2 family nucleotide transporter [Verrucomicrobiota bacterium]